MAAFLESTVNILELARQDKPPQDTLQLVFVISDGILTSRDRVAKWAREAASRNQLLVFLILDHPGKQDSILQHQTVSFPGGKLTRTPYLNEFPFPYVFLRGVWRASGFGGWTCVWGRVTGVD